MSMRHLALSCVLATLLLFVPRSGRAQDDIQLVPSGGEGAPPAGGLEIRGMHCTPDVQEVETRRPIPVSCTVDYPVAGIELRYRLEGPGKKWEKIELAQGEHGYTGTIPCSVTAKRGKMKLYLFGRNENNKVIARVGRSESPITIRLVEQSSSPPPALPGQQPPQRCYEQNECPPELTGTPACPGTRAPKNAKKGWGGSCSASSECQSGMQCVKGSCETPAKCDDATDCTDGGECVDGLCHVPDAAELEDRMGPPKHHWIGLHAGPDIYLMNAAKGACGAATEDSRDFACFDGGNEYRGTPNTVYSGTVASGVYLATIRALLSYEYAAGRVAAGVRLGWAFRGAPKGFSPVHLEGRFLYSLRKDPFNATFRPYLGLALGYAQVDASGSVNLVDCKSEDEDARAECLNAATPAALSMLNPAVATAYRLDAYRSGSRFFFGPALKLMFAISNESAVVLNLNTMFPNVTFQPTLGYELGL
jgi:hypothetical protein